MAGNALKKLAGKLLSIEYRVPWKEATGLRQYGLNTPDGANVVHLITEEALFSTEDLCAILAIGGSNAFNEAKIKRS